MKKILYYVDQYLPPSQTFVFDQISELSKSFDIKVLCESNLMDNQFHHPHIVDIGHENKWLKWLRLRLIKRNIYLKILDHALNRQAKQVVNSFTPDFIFSSFRS